MDGAKKEGKNTYAMGDDGVSYCIVSFSNMMMVILHDKPPVEDYLFLSLTPPSPPSPPPVRSSAVPKSVSLRWPLPLTRMFSA